jgi:hypothetical protein
LFSALHSVLQTMEKFAIDRVQIAIVGLQLLLQRIVNMR